MNNEKIIRVFMLFFIIALNCQLFNNDDKDDYTLDETPPALSVSPVDITQVASIMKFGVLLSGTQKNPAFEYYLNNSDVDVRSSSNGYVERIFLNESFPDYEVWIQPVKDSAYRLIYDHIKILTIAEGDTVYPGFILGKVGEGNRTELQVNHKENNSELSYCPFYFGTDEFINQHKSFTDEWCIEDTVQP